MEKTYVYIGSWNLWGVSQGLNICEYDVNNGSITLLESGVGGALCVGHTHIDAKRGLLYCIDERAGYREERIGGGRICAFAINPQNGSLNSLGAVSSFGAQPSYIAADKTGKYLLVTNYGSQEAWCVRTRKNACGEYALDLIYSDSSVVLFRRNDDGTVGQPCDIVTLHGEGPRSYQATSHAHCIQPSPDGKFFAVCDNGGDRLYLFTIDYENEKLVLCRDGTFISAPGSMPRYCVFHPTLPYIYLNKECENTISALRYTPTGSITHICTVPSTAKELDIHQEFMQSSLVISSDGNYIYDLHRGINTVSVLRVDDATGRPKLVQSVGAGVAGPRGCAISPDGRFLLVAGQSGGAVCAIPIEEDGLLGSPLPAAKNILNPGTVDFYTAVIQK